jgi:hypothetical protein
MTRPRRPKFVVLDVETEPFSGAFRTAMDEATRQRRATYEARLCL